MQNTTLAQENWYTWASRPWLNSEASYHRMVFEDRTNIHSLENIQLLFHELLWRFEKSTQSRLVIRTLLSSENQALHKLDAFVEEHDWQLWYYHNYQEVEKPFIYTTISVNRQDRWLWKVDLKAITDKNRSYVDRILQEIESFEEYNLKKIEHFISRGFNITMDINPKELTLLWWDTFGWSEKACKDLLLSNDGSFPIGVRDATKRLVAVVLYSHQPHMINTGELIQHWETTEASTLLEYQGNGIMPILVTWLHVKVLSRWIKNVYGELRAVDIQWDKPNSVNHWLKSWKIIHFPIQSSPLLINHVSIGWIPESYNINREIQWYLASPTEELRSFLVGSMDPTKLTQKLRDIYTSIIN